MRIFIVPGHRVTTSGDWSLNDLAGSTGRLDILLRCVNASFFLSNSIRQDVEIYLVLLGSPEPPKTVKFVGSELKYLNPDERSTAALVRTALIKKCTGGWAKSTPGIYIARKGFSEVLAECTGNGGQIVWLKENSVDIRTLRIENPIFVLGDQFDLTKEEENVLLKYPFKTISLGQKSLHTDHCITLVNNEMDRCIG